MMRARLSLERVNLSFITSVFLASVAVLFISLEMPKVLARDRQILKLKLGFMGSGLQKGSLETSGNIENTESNINSQTTQHIGTIGASNERANATFYTLCRNEELYQMLETVQNYEDRFNSKFKYDWVFLNDYPFTDEFKRVISHAISGEAKFGQVPASHWRFPDHIDQQKVYESMDKMDSDNTTGDYLGLPIPYAKSISYRHMCRYQSGFFYKHGLLQGYKYFWRVEPDVKLYCDIDYDVFKSMEQNGKRYGFVISMMEFEKTIESLFKEVKNYLQMKGVSRLLEDTDNLSDFVYDELSGDYTLCHFWSNFEIGDLDFFRGREYNEFFDYLDSKGGFYYERWGDAPIHSIAVSLFMQWNDVKWFSDIGYRHPPYLSCPLSEEVRLEKKCSCDPKQDFTMDAYSCTRFYQDIIRDKQKSQGSNP
ncbi:Putative mannosyltransferase [Komagataella phaffii CBS 7435]|uniref:Putative mannosyltransferase n=1 Tax=Komagataella phaffii (strain ATCC 76273 / CBS 7435 / CECT 11047 / NRRL Y-11430 / Wegner 21-1) TaxID=981350 RepID=F2QM19_KOMPC|nr:GQ67_02392T0 [Komagataella phaffii]AOA65401.1 GQ68_02855T0 [Komagataella phaffii GS115]CAH2445853.1 Putative mannosyltransferase [Komagataella phaffii CBS 7435]CCA36307.1 Putative mannosyltransferase [Komagataella phaffii CBS 7435]